MKRISLLLLITLLVIGLSLCTHFVYTNFINFLLTTFIFICSLTPKFNSLKNLKKAVTLLCTLYIYISITLTIIDFDAQSLIVQILFFVPATVLTMCIFYYIGKFVKEKE